MNILALDTATAALSLALAAGEDTWYAGADAGMRHSELLMDLAEGLLKRAGLEAADLDGVLCMGGPGSFTGLRIGFAAAKGLSLALSIPWAAVPTLDCMAFPRSVWPGPVIPAVDAKKNSFFSALYRGGRRLSDYLDAAPAEIAALIAGEIREGPALLTGPDAPLLREQLEGLLPAETLALLRLDPAGGGGRARELLELGKIRRVLEESPGELYEGPLYLRKSDAEINLANPGAGGA